MSIQNSHQISDVKILLKQGATGASIVSITKTGTSGLVDTYTVATSDGGRYTFEVTNGSDIQSIEKTSSHGMVDTYTVTLTNGNTTTFEVTNGDNWIDNSEKTATDAFQTITGGLLKECKVALSPVQSGSGNPSPTNVRPIAGHTEVSVNRVGKNLYVGAPSFDGYDNISTYSVASETYNGHEVIYKGTAWNGACKNIPVKAGKTYTFSAMVKCSTPANVYIYNGTDTQIAVKNVGTTWTKISGQINPDRDYSARLRVELAVSGPAIYIAEYQLEEGSPATSFEPYEGTTYTVEIPAETGTVYGGTLDLVSGKMVIDTKYLDVDDFNIFSAGKSAGDLYWADVENTGSKINGNAVVSMLPVDNIGGWASTVPCVQVSTSVAGRVRVYCADTTMEAFKATYADLQICVEMENPIIVQLTPQDIVALVGQNNLSCPLAGQAMVEDGVKYFYIYTYHDLMEGLQSIADAMEEDVTEITNNAVEEVSEMAGVWTTPATAEEGDTSITISDASITTSSIIEVYCQNASGNPVSVTNMTVTTGQAVLSFYALAENTTFKLHVLN